MSFRLSWTRPELPVTRVTYPKIKTPEEALKQAVKDCPFSLPPGTEVTVERVDAKLNPIGFVKKLTVPELQQGA